MKMELVGFVGGSRAYYKPELRPSMRSLATGLIFKYDVKYSPEKLVEIVYHNNRGANGRLRRCWQVRHKNGSVFGEWTGNFSTAEEAYQKAVG
jgi:hypothetical protein